MRRSAPPTWLLATLCALAPLSIDLGLPALPAIGRAFGAGAGATGLSISLFMAGFAATPLVYGLASDRWGRRPLLLAGLALYAAGGLACALAPTLPLLLCGRLVQGAGAGSGPTIAFAATRDTQRGAELGRRLALFTTLLNAAPVVAPSLGTACLAITGWRGVWGLLAALGAALLLLVSIGFGETHHGRGAGGSALRTAWLALRRRPASLAHAATYGLGAAAMFSYVATSSLLLIGSFHISNALYSGLFAMTGSAIMAGAALSTRAPRMVAPVLLFAGPAAATLLLAFLPTTLAGLMACLAAGTFGYGLLAPAAAHSALKSVPEVAGVASALLTSVQMLCMSAASLVASMLFATSGPIGTPLAMTGFAVVTGGVMIVSRILEHS